MPAPLIKPISCSVEWLVSDIDHGNLGLPDIQRPFVWSNAQVRDLFDSMFRGYPVGFLLFWAAPFNSGNRQIGSLGHGTDSPSLLIIDGQQRLTSLYAVMKGMPMKHILRYTAVPSTASSGVDVTWTMASARKYRITAATTESDMKRTAEFPIPQEMFFLFPAPTACPMLTVVPIASPTIMTVSICMI